MIVRYATGAKVSSVRHYVPCLAFCVSPEERRLTVAGRRRRYHDAKVGRGARTRDDGRGEEASRRQLAARAQSQHLEVAHLAGDAVPLPPPCAPPHATGAGTTQPGPRRHSPPLKLPGGKRPVAEGYGRERELVSRGLDAVHVNKGG